MQTTNPPKLQSKKVMDRYLCDLRPNQPSIQRPPGVKRSKSDPDYWPPSPVQVQNRSILSPLPCLSPRWCLATRATLSHLVRYAWFWLMQYHLLLNICQCENESYQKSMYYLRNEQWRITDKRKFNQSNINPLNTKRRLLYLKTQSVPLSKHFSSRL